MKKNRNNKFPPVKLPYSYDELEPQIDEETMIIHYNKHYMSYLMKFNTLCRRYKITDSIVQIMRDIDKYPIEVRDNGGGYINHSLFWKTLKPNPDEKDNLPDGVAEQLINQHYGSLYDFKDLIVEASKKRVGSGWIWWVMNRDGSTNIVATPYNDNPFMSAEGFPLFGIDVWEHSYYLQYDADREDYIDSIFEILDWKEINRRCITGNRSISDVKIVV